MADGRSSRHDHPEIDSADDGGWDAGPAPDRMDRPEGAMVTNPLTRVQSGAPPQSQSHPLYDWFVQITCLLVGRASYCL